MESIFKLGILLSVIDKVSGPSAKIGQSMTGLRGRVMSLGPAFDKFKTYGLIITTVAAGVLNMMSGMVMATTASQAALGEVSSVGIENLAALERAGLEFSNQWSGTTKAQFISAAYDIKSGISSLSDAGVAEFTKLAALTGKATKSTTAEMTSLFATGYGIYKDMYGDLSDMQFGQMFSAGIAASVKNFKTTGSGMAQAISQLGATAATANVSFEEQLTILGMLQATMSGSEAGTKYKAMLQAAAGAGEKLNLQFLDANNQLLSMPEILLAMKAKYGETLDAVEKMEIQKAFGTQEAVAMIDLLYGKIGALQTNIKGLSGDMTQGESFAQKMAVAMNIDPGAGMALLSQQFHNLVDILGKQLLPVVIPVMSWIGAIITRMIGFAESHKTTTRIVVLFAGAVAATVFALGVMAAGFGAVGLLIPNMITGFASVKAALIAMKARMISAAAATRFWIMWQRQAFLTAVYMEGGILAYAKALMTAPFRALQTMTVATWGHIKAMYGQLSASIVAAGGIKAYAFSMGGNLLKGIVAATKATWAFNTALLTNPLTWVVLAVAGLVAGLIILEKEFGILTQAWDAFMYGLGYIAGAAMTTGKALLDAFMAPFRFLGSLIDEVGGIGNALKSLFKIVLSVALPPLAIGFYWDEIKEGIPAMLSWVQGMGSKFLASGQALWTSLISGIRSGVSAGIAVTQGFYARISGFAGQAVNKFKSMIPAILKVVKVILSIAFPPLAIAFNWDAVKAGAGKLVSWIKGMVPEFLASGRALWGAFTDGIKSMASAPVETVKSGLAKLRNLLPFSDAKEGPLSTLTLSGMRLMETLGAGIQSAGPGLVKSMAGALSGVMAFSGSLFSPGQATAIPKDPAPLSAPAPALQAQVPTLVEHLIQIPKSVPADPAPIVQTTPVQMPEIVMPAPEVVTVQQPAQPAALPDTKPVLEPVIVSLPVAMPKQNSGTRIIQPAPAPMPEIVTPAPEVVTVQQAAPPAALPDIKPVLDPVIVPPPVVKPMQQVLSSGPKTIAKSPIEQIKPAQMIKNVSVLKNRTTRTHEIKKNEYHFHINGLSLPNVDDANGFVQAFVEFAEGHDV